MMNCSAVNKLKEAYVEGLVRADLRTAIERHITDCRTCRQKIEIAEWVRFGTTPALKSVLGEGATARGSMEEMRAMRTMEARLEHRLAGRPRRHPGWLSPAWSVPLALLVLLLVSIVRGGVGVGPASVQEDPVGPIVSVPNWATAPPAGATAGLPEKKITPIASPPPAGPTQEPERAQESPSPEPQATEQPTVQPLSRLPAIANTPHTMGPGGTTQTPTPRQSDHPKDGSAGSNARGIEGTRSLQTLTHTPMPQLLPEAEPRANQQTRRAVDPGN